MSSLLAAKKSFEQKFKEKTGNDWSNCANFQPCSGKYTLIKIDYGTAAIEEQVRCL